MTGLIWPTSYIEEGSFDFMNQKSTVMLAVFVALGVTLAAGLIAIPAIHEAQASLIGNAISDRIKLHNALRNQIIGGSCNCD